MCVPGRGGEYTGRGGEYTGRGGEYTTGVESTRQGWRVHDRGGEYTSRGGENNLELYTVYSAIITTNLFGHAWRLHV